MGPETGVQEEEEIRKYQEFKNKSLCPMNNFGVCKGERCAWFDIGTSRCAVLLFAQAILPMDFQQLE
jgi:hypothetical protein